MNQKEFLNLNKDFEEVMRERCKEEGISFQKLPANFQGFGGTLFMLGNEVYELYNDGNTASWQFKGFMQNNGDNS